ncbi:MAG TPA: T9SS type A sorting domain-containing protein [Gemmatimonadales bacterium]|nr:T9SS type A sorting domain-containing protein [Gemmatimonadales bacterium]
MHSTFRLKTLAWAGLVALVVGALAPSPAGAVPEPGAKGRGFRLFARSLGALTVNRIYCGLNSTGQVCVDSSGSSTIGGGYWPKGTADQYIFNTGLQLAGVIQGGPWDGDTTGAFFFDPKGTTEHGVQVQPIYNTLNPDDAANWPAAARVPVGDASADLFDPLLQGRIAASQGDIWFMSWEGDPAANAGRSHPLGVAVETRGFGWNYPSGNEDIIYFLYTFYNVTSRNPADYATVRPEIRDILLAQAQVFAERNSATFGVTIPEGGYLIDPLYAAFGTDHDVAEAGINYASVNLPFALGYTYDQSFYGPTAVSDLGWSFDPGIFSEPFFAGPGFTGVKYLKSPDPLAAAGSIQLYSNTINGGAFGDAQNTTQLFRYLSGNISTAAGDAPCTYNPVLDRICFLNNASAADMRFFQSSTGFDLPPGQARSIVVAYIHAAPVAVPGFAPNANTSVKPGDPRGLGNPSSMAASINMVDSLTGYLGFTDADASGTVEQNEFLVVPGSLLDKSLVAQSIFDSKFLLPFAPDVPEFFLVPGDNEMTILWQPSATEATGDPFFAVASAAQIDGNANPLYDPNYRSIETSPAHGDVEGYRIFRGRVDNPNQMALLAQFDYAGTTIRDYDALVNPTPGCAPELAPQVTADCAVAYDVQAPGVARTVFAEHNLAGDVIQVVVSGGRPQRVQLADGSMHVLDADSAATGGASGLPQLSDNGVPFAYVDRTARNGFRYFYVVTAFDLNSRRSGPSSLESPRSATKSATPVRQAVKSAAASLDVGLYDRDGNLLRTELAAPAIDGLTGRFAGPFPAANAWNLGFSAFVGSIVSTSGAISLRLDSLSLGFSDYGDGLGVPTNYYFTLNTSGGESQLTVPLQQDAFDHLNHSATYPFDPVSVDGDLAANFGGSDQYQFTPTFSLDLAGQYYSASFGRGCVNGAVGFEAEGASGCDFNGSRWFMGPSPLANESKANPTAGNGPNSTAVGIIADPDNAGELAGVETIYNPYSYQTIQTIWRGYESVLAGGRRAADYNLYWGAGGLIDSVIDVTHNVPVPFDANKAAGSYGVLNQAAAQPSGVGQSFDQRAELSHLDLSCVEPWRSIATNAEAPQSRAACATAAGGDGPTYLLSQTAIPGPIVLATGALTNSRTLPAAANAGFLLYLAGNVFMIELTGGALPAEGTIWSMRDYVGAIAGGNNGAGRNLGSYRFTEQPRPLTAAGVELRMAWQAADPSQPLILNNKDLANVHTVPDPYYVTNPYEQTSSSKIIRFVNLPQQAIIRIYTASGVLVRVLDHNSSTFAGEAVWDVRNRNNQVVASGVYFYHIESGEARKVGRFTVVNFAQ